MRMWEGIGHWGVIYAFSSHTRKILVWYSFAGDGAMFGEVRYLIKEGLLVMLMCWCGITKI